MKHVIIGTAGHVDHGKTALIKALTGINSDRLKEEQKRGITIELGFAHLEFEDGTQAGIIDVPGHESFIKNMLMGAGGIDLAMLVVAADEGFMPQTIEHLEILSLLNIKSGLVVITKTDLVDKDFLDMVTDDVREHTRGTFLEGCEIIPVSAYTGDGIPYLKEHLMACARAAAEKNSKAPFRLPVDRVFSIGGFGTVVTGTLLDGSIEEGAEAEICPLCITARVRGVEVHGEKVKAAFAGQRVAVNIAGVKREDLERGSVVAAPGSVPCAKTLDASISVLQGSDRTIKNGSTVHFYHGAMSTLCKVNLLDSTELLPGQSGVAQLIPDDPVAAREGDRFVLRFYSPLETIGGGVILKINPPKHRRFDENVIARLKMREHGSEGDRLFCALADGFKERQSAAQIAKSLLFDGEAMSACLSALLSADKIVEYSSGYFAPLDDIEALGTTAKKILWAFHKQSPLAPGMKREELRQKLFGKGDISLLDALLAVLADKNYIKIGASLISAPDFAVVYSEKHKKLIAMITEKIRGFSPPELEELYAACPKDKEDLKQVISALIGDGSLVLLNPQIAISGDAYSQALALLKAHFGANDSLSLAQTRDMLGTSRKYALALLEYCDRLKITKLMGDARVLIGTL